MPNLLEEAMVEIDGLLHPEDKEYILQSDRSPDDVAIEVHHSLGRFLRNELGLWVNSPLALYLRQERRIIHPDDMSHFLLVQYCRWKITSRLERIPLELEEVTSTSTQ
jgi:hypothetical protein